MAINIQNFQQNKCRQNIAFKQKICFVGPREFLSLNASAYISDFDLYNSKILRPSIRTDDAYDCIISTIMNTKAKLLNMSHLMPISKFNQDNVEYQTYKEALCLYNKEPSKMEGLILGGKSKWNFPCKDYIKSPVLFKKTLRVFDKISKDFGLDYSIFALQKFSFIYGGSNRTNVVSDAVNNTHYILADCLMDESYFIETPKDLFRHYGVIKLAENDTVKIGDRDVTEELKAMLFRKNKS